MNIRIKFQKYGVMKFVGHLDMMRYFQKAIRRAGIDIAYSEGYNPHQIMSFAAPLGLGVTSDGEYFDIAVKSSRSSRESLENLNRAMVEGISVLEYRKLPDTAKTSMSLVAAADYLVYAREEHNALFSSLENLKSQIHDFYEKQPEILITKQTKKSRMELNLKPLIYEMKGVNLREEYPDLKESPAGHLGIFLKVCTGSSDNIKPELVLEAFCRFCGLDYEPLSFQVHRLEVYAKSEEIPVKGEQERKAYENYLKQLKQSHAEKKTAFPEFLTLGELGEDIIYGNDITDNPTAVE